MSIHPAVPYDDALIEEISARMDLRVPNRRALEAVAERFDESAGDPFEAVCDLATAVGKTYLAGGLIEYLAMSGARHFLLVVPGRTILEKTVNNFTTGHPKSLLGGMETDPLVITADNFNTSATGAALRDDTQVKLFLFTVQSLIRPKKSDRKVRKHQEWLGEDLYQYLKDADDLVILADEHHVYSEKARAFSDAVRELDPMALIGLTATPAKSDLHKRVYHYPLARAIADQYVKTPVLVGRKDDATGVETQLRDGLLLLEAKQKTADAYASATGQASINAVMFVVADTIDNANAVAEVLRKPGLFADDYDQRVLVVHSDAPDDALARLATVEEPDSPVRVIVSVSMLKEGWDVKNIYVICSFRPSISEALTEQTLGRGLRLPWDAYTGQDLLDTVEVLSHERYEKLLAKAGVLLEGLTEQRVKPIIEPTAPDSPTDGAPPGGSADAVVVRPASEPAAGTAGAQPPQEATVSPHIGSGGQDGDAGGHRPSIVITSLEQRSTEAEEQAAAAAKPVEPAQQLTLPKVVRTVTARSFSLSNVSEQPFTELGQRLAEAGTTKLDRKRLNVVADATAPAGLRLVPTETTEVIDASRPHLPYGDAGRALREAICSFDVVPSDRPSVNAAKRLADAVVAGAGDEDAVAAYLNAAIARARIIINSQYRRSPEVVTTTVESQIFVPSRVNSRPVEENRFGPFSRKVAYSGWSKSLHPLNWFDSAPERTLANLLDADDDTVLWSRIQRGELVVEWEGGRYSPDFYLDTAETKYLLEVKADKDVDSDVVQAKKAAAEEWARFVTDNGDHGTWRYVLVSEAVLKTAKTLRAVLTQTLS